MKPQYGTCDVCDKRATITQCLAAGIETWACDKCRGIDEPAEPAFEPLDILCSWAEYDRATPEQQRDWDQRLLQSWNDRRASEIADDHSWDRRFSYIGE